MASEATTVQVQGPHGVREVRVSSPSRVLWPEAGITKLGLAEYMIAVGDAFVLANGDRPVSLQRFPTGVDGEEFYSKNPPKGAPDFIRSVPVVYPSGRSHPQLVIDEPAAAVWAIHMNTITFHPWASRAGNSDNPRPVSDRPGPATRHRFCGCRNRRCRAAFGHGRGRTHGVRQDVRQPRTARFRPHPARARVSRRTSCRDRGMPRA